MSEMGGDFEARVGMILRRGRQRVVVHFEG